MNGLLSKASTDPGAVRSMVMSGRPSTSRARDSITQRRVSPGATGRAAPVARPREAFQRLRASSSWSGGEVSGQEHLKENRTGAIECSKKDFDNGNIG